MTRLTKTLRKPVGPSGDKARLGFLPSEDLEKEKPAVKQLQLFVVV